MGAWGHHEQVRKVNIGLVWIGNNQRVLIQFYSNTDLQNIKSFVFEKKKLFFTLKFNILYFYKNFLYLCAFLEIIIQMLTVLCSCI